MKIKSILIFCGSSKGNNPIYEATARQVGQTLAKHNIHLIYGGGNVGLMGILADEMLANGGTVTGIIPYFLKEREVCHTGLTEVVVVESMAERKLVMAQRSQGVITLPGGYGTLDELFEMLTLSQLGKEKQPIGILNVNHFFDPLLAQVERMYQDQFLKEVHKNMLLVDEQVEGLLTKMENYQPSVEEKWVKP